MKPGKYVVIEGHDGTGKSTQVGLIRQKLLENGIDSIEFHEPTGTPTVEAIRTVIKDGLLERNAMTNLLLFSASRHEIWHKLALSEINKGKWVVASRNYFSTIAYQGYGEGLDIDIINTVTKISTDEQYMNPDIVLILDLDDEKERTKRISSRGKLEKPDTFESKDDTFQTKVRNAYINIAKSRNIPIVSAAQTVDEINQELWDYIIPHLKSKK